MPTDETKPDRRSFLKTTVGAPGLALSSLNLTTALVAAPAIPSSGAVSLSKAHIAAVERNRRIVMNYDALASLLRYERLGGTQDPDKFKRHMLGILDYEDNQIDSVGWCWSEGNEAPYPSKVLPTLLDHPVFKVVPEGIDLLQMGCEESHRRGIESFFSLRINGGDHDRSYLERRIPKLPKKWNNKDWLINWNPDPEGTPQYMSPFHKSAFWNFAAKGLRDHKVSVLREVAENYDFDGIEVDFARNSPVLQPDQQWQDRDKLTAFMRSLRFALLEVERKRGRPFLLAARVPETVVGCHFDGIDVETWVRDQLVDILNLGCRSMEVDISAFRRLTAGTAVKLYPSNDFAHTTDGYKPIPLKVGRGIYANWWHQEPDGVYTFNFHYYNQDFGLYREIGSPETLKYKDKTFVMQRRGGGHAPLLTPYPDDWSTPRFAYANTNMLGQLPATLDKASKADNLLFLHIADDVNAAGDRLKSVELRILLSKEAAIEARLNGVRLRRPHVDKLWSEFATSPELFAVGSNLISVRFAKPQSDAESDVSIEKVEVNVAYR